MFSVWLSHQFSRDSTSALDSVKSLSNEIKGLTQANLNQQKDFSVKMLDSIIDSNRFGSVPSVEAVSGPSALEQVVKNRLDAAESRISSNVESTVRRLITEGAESSEKIDAAVTSIKDDIGKLADSFQDISSDSQRSPELTRMLRKLLPNPAHFLVLNALIESGATSSSDLEPVASDFNLPPEWTSGIANLIKDGLVMGELDSFVISPDIKTGLASWLDQNRETIRQLSSFYSENDEGSVTKEELAIALGLTF